MPEEKFTFPKARRWKLQSRLTEPTQSQHSGLSAAAFLVPSRARDDIHHGRTCVSFDDRKDAEPPPVIKTGPGENGRLPIKVQTSVFVGSDEFNESNMFPDKLLDYV